MMKCSFAPSKTTLAAVPALEDLQLLAPAELLPLLLQLSPGRQQPRHLRGRVPQLQLVPLLCIVIVIIIIIIIFITNLLLPTCSAASLLGSTPPLSSSMLLLLAFFMMLSGSRTSCQNTCTTQ